LEKKELIREKRGKTLNVLFVLTKGKKKFTKNKRVQKALSWVLKP